MRTQPPGRAIRQRPGRSGVADDGAPAGALLREDREVAASGPIAAGVFVHEERPAPLAANVDV